MTIRTLLAMFVASVSFVACVDKQADEAADTEIYEQSARRDTCSDVRYNNGRCDAGPDWTCLVPDVDCFRTFRTYEEMTSWYRPMHRLLNEVPAAGCETTGPQPGPDPVIYAKTSAQGKRVQRLADEGWASFKETRPLGLLANARPIAIVIKEANPNAFVIPETFTANRRAALAVIVHDSLLANLDDEKARAVMMHELQHAVGMHAVGGVRERITKWYMAPVGGEPYGKDQQNNVAVQGAGEEWIDQSGIGGIHTTAKLGSAPFVDWGWSMYVEGYRKLTARSAACNAAVDAYDNARMTWIKTGLNFVDWTLNDAVITTGEPDALISKVSQACFATSGLDLITVIAQAQCTTKAQVMASLSPEEQRGITGKNYLEQVRYFVGSSRTRMRTIEGDLTRRTSLPFSRIRYYNTEEEADVVSASVMKFAGDRASVGIALLALGGPDEQGPCDTIVNAGKVPGYGRLDDNHHSNCYRAWNDRKMQTDQNFRRRDITAVHVEGDWAKLSKATTRLTGAKKPVIIN